VNYIYLPVISANVNWSKKRFEISPRFTGNDRKISLQWMSGKRQHLGNAVRKPKSFERASRHNQGINLARIYQPQTFRYISAHSNNSHIRPNFQDFFLPLF